MLFLVDQLVWLLIVPVRTYVANFAYPGSSTPVLSGLNLTLHPGQTVAIVGENGVGKTTLVKLLAGLYRPRGRRIIGDGVEPHTRRSARAVLFQDYVRYPTSLRDNVTWAVPGAGADDQAVREALAMAGGEGLPSDLDTLLWREGTGGTDLSGGQWQRVALARVSSRSAPAGRVQRGRPADGLVDPDDHPPRARTVHRPVEPHLQQLPRDRGHALVDAGLARRGAGPGRDHRAAGLGQPVAVPARAARRAAAARDPARRPSAA